MNSFTVSVSDPALSKKIDAWQDGASYTLEVVQDSPGQFTATSAEEAEMPAEEAAPEEESDMGGEMGAGMGGKGMMGGRTPAVAVVIAKGRK